MAAKTYRYTVLHDGPERKVTVIEGSKTKATLETLQKLVDGYIQILPSPFHASLQYDGFRVGPNFKIYVNEEGKYRTDFQDNLHFDLVHTAGAHTWIDPIRGPAVIEEIVHG